MPLLLYRLRETIDITTLSNSEKEREGERPGGGGREGNVRFTRSKEERHHHRSAVCVTAVSKFWRNVMRILHAGETTASRPLFRNIARQREGGRGSEAVACERQYDRLIEESRLIPSSF